MANRETNVFRLAAVCLVLIIVILSALPCVEIYTSSALPDAPAPESQKWKLDAVQNNCFGFLMVWGAAEFCLAQMGRRRYWIAGSILALAGAVLTSRFLFPDLCAGILGDIGVATKWDVQPIAYVLVGLTWLLFIWQMICAAAAPKGPIPKDDHCARKWRTVLILVMAGALLFLVLTIFRDQIREWIHKLLWPTPWLPPDLT